MTELTLDLKSPIDDVEHQGSTSSVDSVEVAGLLKTTPEFAQWRKDQLVAIIPFIQQRVVKNEQLLFKAGDKASEIFIVVDGEVDVGGETVKSTGRALGLETIVGDGLYLNDAIVHTYARVLSIPTHVLPALSYEDNTSFHHTFFSRWYGKSAQQAPRIAKTTVVSDNMVDATAKIEFKAVLGWFLAIGVPVFVALLSYRFALPWYQNYYLTILSGCTVMLLLKLVPQYAAVLVAALACLLLDVAPADVVLSGFASGGFFMALSIFGLGSVLVRSGLASRLVLTILRFSPQTSFWHNTLVMISGIIMTPCLPSANARISLMTPLMMNVSRAVGYRDASKETTQLMLSMFVGCSIFAPIFLTSKSLNFVLYDMLPQQVSEAYQWLNWFYAAAGAGLVMFVLYIGVSTFIFRKGKQPVLSRSHFEAQLRMQGPMDRGEWIALIGIVLFILAITSYSFHKISPFWIAFGTFCVFLIVEALRDEHIHNDIEWDALLLIGFFIGLENALDYTGISYLLTDSLSGMTMALDGNIYLFAGLIMTLVVILRLFLPITTAGVLAASVILPLAKISGFDPWIACFIILMISECWVWPAQCSYYGSYKAASGDDSIENSELFKRFNYLTIVIRLIAILVLIQYFQWMGLL